MKFQVSAAPSCAGPIRERNLTWLRDPSPTPKALLRVAQGCNAQRATLGKGHSPTTRYPEGVIADRERFGNNAFSVEEQDDLNPG